MHYALLLPGADPAAALTLPWLAALARDRQPVLTPATFRTPDGSPGLFATWPAAGGKPLSVEVLAGWKWERGHGTDDFWTGADPERPITPESVAREKQIPGAVAELPDGSHWLIPTIDNLPGRYGADGRGGFAKRVAAEYRDYEAGLKRLVTSLCVCTGETAKLSRARPDWVWDKADAAKTTLADWFTVCCAALAINYRVNEPILSWLGIIDNASALRIVGAATNLVDILSGAEQSKPATLHFRYAEMEAVKVGEPFVHRPALDTLSFIGTGFANG